MPIVDDLIAAAQQASADVPVQDVLIGLYWMAVRSRRIGLATAQVDSGNELIGTGDLHQKSVYEMIEYFRSARLIEASLGLAAINSMLPVEQLPMVEFNARDLLVEKGRGKKVALIGHFAFTEPLRQAAGR